MDWILANWTSNIPFRRRVVGSLNPGQAEWASLWGRLTLPCLVRPVTGWGVNVSGIKPHNWVANSCHICPCPLLNTPGGKISFLSKVFYQKEIKKPNGKFLLNFNRVFVSLITTKTAKNQKLISHFNPERSTHKITTVLGIIPTRVVIFCWGVISPEGWMIADELMHVWIHCSLNVAGVENRCWWGKKEPNGTKTRS